MGGPEWTSVCQELAFFACFWRSSSSSSELCCPSSLRARSCSPLLSRERNFWTYLRDCVARMADQRAERVEFYTREIENENSRRRRQRLLPSFFFLPLCSFLSSLSPLSSPLQLPQFTRSGRPPEGPARAREGRDAPEHLQQQGALQGELPSFSFFPFSFLFFGRRETSLRAIFFFFLCSTLSLASTLTR